MSTAASELDPIYPLPAGTGIPEIKAGEGKELFQRKDHAASGRTYRSFYVMWEQVERRAAEHYPKYVGGPFDHVAQTWLEAVIYCRQVAHPNIRIEAISEKKAAKIRAKEAEKAKKAKTKKAEPAPEEAADDDGTPNECPKCGINRTILKKKSKKTGEKLWVCADCNHRWPREGSQKATTPSTRRSKATKTAPGSKAPGKKKPASSGKKKRAKKGS